MFSNSIIPALLPKTGTIASSGENEVIAAIPGKYINVYRYKLRTASTVAVVVTVKNDASGTVVDTDILQAPTAGVFGTNESVDPPAFLFRSAKGKPLIINLNGAVSVTYTLSYFESEL